MKIIILDFSTSEVAVYNYDEGRFDNAEDWFEDNDSNFNNHKESECQYMIVEELNIKIN